MNGSRRAWGVRWLAAGVAGWLLASCAWLPSPPEGAREVPGGVIVERYLADQEARRQGPVHWSVEGVLEMETPEQGRRNRIDLLGSGRERVRMRAYGPFRQVAAELLAWGDRVRWVDPERRSVLEVPANAAGMAHLLGVPIPPERFFQVITGRAAGLSSSGPFPLDENGVTVMTRDGERLRLDPVHGRLLERSGGGKGKGAPYRVVYRWPELPEGKSADLRMPAGLVITLEKPTVRLELSFQGWRFPASGPADSSFDQAIRSGFSLSRPLEPER
ncbi:MAG: hypothetical protein HQM00_04615 [Magnetococcales bacterium]|nr:hypothetical protein [Magnetococcales bacterium]